MKFLRDKKKLTQFLILYYSALNKPKRLGDIAEELEMTNQGVSNYVSELEEKGLMDTTGKTYHPTSDGMEFIRDTLSELNVFLEDASHDLVFIERCTAIADESIKEGEEVGLFMKDGLLHASLEESSSMGTALSEAEKDQPLVVGGLHGITELEVGDIYLLRVDVEKKKDSISELAKDTSKKLHGVEYDKVAVLKEGQYGIANLLDLDVDIFLSPIESSIHAAEKGLNVIFLLPSSDVERSVERINSRNRERDEEYKIDYTIL